MTNPVLAKSEAFSPAQAPAQQSPLYTQWQPPQDPYAQQNWQQNQAYAPQGQPYAQPQAGYQQTWQPPIPQPTTQKVMTLDDVLTKTAITIGTTVVVAIMSVWAVLYFGLSVPTLAGAGLICGLATIIFPFIAAARRQVGPGLAIAFAILEGVFIGAISLIFEVQFNGIVLQAVLATFVAAGLTLAAFHFGKFRLSTKMRKIVMISMLAYVVVALLNLGLSFAGINLGLFPGPTGQVSWLAWLAAGVGVVLAVLSLVDDFQYVEQGIANRAPASESWRAAYGLTVTLVWLYVNLLRILSYIRR